MKKRNFKFMSIVMTAIMSITLLASNKGTEAKAYTLEKSKNARKTLLENLESKILNGDKFSNVEVLEVDNENSTLHELGNPEERVRVIVELNDTPATLMLEDGEQPTEELIEKVNIGGSMHGMHVAGIVAANASQEEVNNNAGVQGVAPEAQVLAMKVFTNNPEIEGAFSDDIIAALEASVELDADIINMSLGSTAGYRDAEDPEQVAIKNATDDGVICVVSAGNSATSLDPYIVSGVSDTAVVGSSGLASDALQVASSENSVITLPALEANK